MKVIYKYKFKIGDVVEIKLPRGANILTIQSQGVSIYEEIFLWALIDTDVDEYEKHIFYVYGTGNEVDAFIVDLNHVATVQNNGMVWHIFQQ